MEILKERCRRLEKRLTGEATEMKEIRKERVLHGSPFF